MKEEKFICGVCNKEIDTKKEFAKLDHFEKKDKLKNTGYYHISCFRDRLHGGETFRQLSAKADWILNQVAGKLPSN